MEEPVHSAAAASSQHLVLGRYRPLKPLGTGGSGSVWLAKDERSGLDVALKIVPREGKAGMRAEREAKAAAALRHERCLRAYSLGRDPSHVYIAYEYVPGRTLREALRAGDLTDKQAVEAAAQILEGLAHAHARGIVHRDVKPANVMLSDAADVDVRILDFGLALMQDEHTLTARGDVPGTLAYISPERLRGEPARPAADVWAVGVILWEALAGRHPFWDGSPMEVQKAILAGAPPLEQLRPDLPPQVLRVVSSALLGNPSHRPPADSLAVQLRELVRKERRRQGGGGPKAPARPRVAELPARVVPAGLAAAVAGWTATALPFYPASWPVGLAALAAALTLARERVGLAFALAVPFFPLGNVSLGLALAYAAAASAWLALTWRDPRSGLLFAAGPLLAPLAALGLLPLAAQTARGPLRRGATVAVGLLVAAVVAGLRHAPLPLGLGTPPLGLGIVGSDRPTAVAAALWHALQAQPGLLVESLALAAAAVALPYVRRRGPWPIALFGAGMLALTALPADGVAVAPLAVATWLTCAVLAWDSGRAAEGGR
jgi:serine/threonine-protein kinase